MSGIEKSVYIRVDAGDFYGVVRFRDMEVDWRLGRCKKIVVRHVRFFLL